jgi:thiol-disulfide isomerase/thioredoxin
LISTGLLAAGCGADGDAGNPDSELTPKEATAPLDAGAPPQLAELRQQANQILDEGTEGFENRIAALEGTPVVVNKWASWCGPCRLEFPFFQSQASERGAEIAFVGVGSNDSTDALETFLGELPLPYPTYHDPDQDIAKQLGGATQAFPATAFYDSTGRRVFTHSGQYRSEEDLAADIDRYAK